MDRIKSVIQHSKGDKSPRSNSDIPRKTTDSHEPPIQRASTDPSEHSGGRSSSEEDRQHLENASLKRQERQQEREEKANQMREEIAKRHRKAWETDPVRANYGEVEPINVGENQPQDEDLPRERLDYIARKSVGTKIAIRARVHHVRPMSAKVAFIVLRQQLSTIQAVLVERDNAVSISMIQWAERLRPETVVIVEGVLQKPQAAKAGEVKSATFHHVEILVGKVHAIGSVTRALPFHVSDVERPRGDSVISTPMASTRSSDGQGPVSPDNLIQQAVERAMEDSRHPDVGSSSFASQPGTPTSPATAAAAASTSHTGAQSASSQLTGTSSATPSKRPGTHTPTGHTVGDDTRFKHRILDLRSNTSQAIFRIQAGVCRFFRTYLDEQGFTEIHTSKFQGGATESGASVFSVDYFSRAAFLAQSPQLGKQGAIAADFERVYEIGPVFRAENSNTHRHLTEFTGLDLEMAFEHDYHEVVNMLDGALLAIFRGLQQHYRREIDVIKSHFPSDDLVFPDKTVRIVFRDGVKMLNDAGWTDNGKPIPEDEDFSTPTERKLGELVKQQFGTDYYILDKFPLSARPFYTMPDKDDARFSNSCDFFIRGEEILSGGQRIHEAHMLEKRMREAKIDPDSMRDYMEGFAQGCPPHGGGGIGLERVVFLFLKLNNIRWATMYPRDPRSFPAPAGSHPASGTTTPAQAALKDKWRTSNDGADTIDFERRRRKGEKPTLPSIEDLIATYGDSPNTSWLDPFWTTWRDSDTAAAIGYATHGHYAVAWGRPLCDDRQLPQVCKAFVAMLESKKLKPIWACIDDATESVLLDKLKWKGVSAVDEQRVNPAHVADAEQEKALMQKVRRAEREGVKVEGVKADEVVGGPLRDEISKRMKDWQEERSGTQVYSADESRSTRCCSPCLTYPLRLRPFDDATHRHYFIARDSKGTLVALVVLAQLSAEHGYQIKYSLDFPGCPTGTIELILNHAVHEAGVAGVNSLTFGGAAAQSIAPAGDHWGVRMKILSRTYATITKTFRLTDRGSFRRKFGAESDPQYVCFPKHGLGVRGVEALMKVLQAEK